MGLSRRTFLGIVIPSIIAAALVYGICLPATWAQEPVKKSRQFTTGKLLVSIAKSPDPRFAQSVILMVRHDAKGALGIIVNRIAGRMSPAELLRRLGKKGDASAGPEIPFHFGGPVALNRALVIHSPDFAGKSTVRVSATCSVTFSPDVLAAIGRGDGPAKSVFALGHAGWGPGQLEGEMRRKAWAVVPYDENIVFDRHIKTKWRRALDRLSVDL